MIYLIYRFLYKFGKNLLFILLLEQKNKFEKGAKHHHHSASTIQFQDYKPVKELRTAILDDPLCHQSQTQRTVSIRDYEF